MREHFNELPFHGIIDIARNATVSKATVGRFLNKLGFIGYADFRRVLENTLTQQKMVPPFELASRIQVKIRLLRRKLYLNSIKMLRPCLRILKTISILIVWINLSILF
ncbi:LacI family DNA-binding transcriptional regulator [Escherichia coli]|nr:LacI family DNA-binding transcriptional regulator [Escherichia coli]